MNLNNFFSILLRIRKGIIFFFILIPLIVGCFRKNESSISSLCNELSITCLSGKQVIEIDTNKGAMIFELNSELAPITVGNFIELVNKGFYEKKPFYRVIREPLKFIIQSGDYKIKRNDISNIGRKNDELIKSNNIKLRFIPLEIKLIDEDHPRYGKLISDPNLLTKIELKHKTGSLSMARTQSINSASTEFFISLNSLPVLDGRYAVFGEIVKGLEIIDMLEEGDYIKKITHIIN
tara:strand:+ start:758 stop:1465 length:708 start_codon:yes stop_codon:yes gene_type:complete